MNARLADEYVGIVAGANRVHWITEVLSDTVNRYRLLCDDRFAYRKGSIIPVGNNVDCVECSTTLWGIP
jgi:hypothetical protein